MALIIPSWLSQDLHDKVFIYTLSDGENIRYVGKSQGIKALKSRYKSHRDVKRDPYLPKTQWINSLKKEGKEFDLEILEAVSPENWEFHEIYWINQMKAWGFNLLNLAEGGDGQKVGYKPSESAMIKIRAANKLIVEKISKIKPSDYEKVGELYKSGVSCKDIAKTYGVKKSHTVKRVLNRLGLYTFGKSSKEIKKDNIAKGIVSRVVKPRVPPVLINGEKVKRVGWNKGKKTVGTEKNWAVGKTTLAQREEIVDLYKTGKYSMSEIGIMYSIHSTAVRGILKRRGIIGKLLVGVSETHKIAMKATGEFRKGRKIHSEEWKIKFAQISHQKTAGKLIGLIDLWSSGNYSILKLSEKFNVNRNTITQYLKRNGVEHNFYKLKKQLRDGV